MHYVYIIYSPSKDRFYIGETIEVGGRLQQHKAGNYSGSSSGYTKDWELGRSFCINTRKVALVIESFVKSMKSKKYLKQLCNDEEAVAKLKERILDKYGILIY